MTTRDSVALRPAEPEDRVFQAVYAPLEVEELLASADRRSRTRRLPAPQLYFSLDPGDQKQLERLLPHITEEQWRTLLDLDLWDRDEASADRLLNWVRLLAEAEDPVARKLLRGTEVDLLELFLQEELVVFARLEEDEFEGEPEEGRAWMQTTDGSFLLVLPEDSEREQAVRRIVERLMGLDSDRLSFMLAEARARTRLELLETAFQEKRRRLEDLGFQDYFDAIEILSPWPADEPLPEKSWNEPEAVSTLPLQLAPSDDARWLLFQAFESLEGAAQPRLLEELFYTCNKLLSARRVPAAEAEEVRRGIREAVVTLNLGLDVWSGSDVGRAAGGLRRHFLASFYQFGRGRLLELQEAARRSRDAAPPEEGSPQEAFLDGLLKDPPRLIEVTDGKLASRDFATAEDLEAARSRL